MSVLGTGKSGLAERGLCFRCANFYPGLSEDVVGAERGWIGDPQPEKEWHTPGWLSEKGAPATSTPAFPP
jgi:hypothetical protein